MSTTLLPATVLTTETIQLLAAQTIEEAQVIVHVSYEVREPGEGIRVWPTTYLVPQDGSEKSKLILFENISLAPFWTILNKKGTYRFTLIFSQLPQGCKLFHLWEDIDQPGGFLIRNIKRNDSDVYEVEL